MTLVADSVRGGTTLSGYNCFTVDEGRTDAEYICGTVSGTSVTSLERAVSPANGTSTVTAIAYSHRAGADVKITDFPLVQRLRNLLNAVEQFPNLLSYVAGTDCTGLSASNSICGKSYIDSVAVAGASNATESVKGIGELATQIEMASSTQLGSTLAGLVLQAKYATSSPYGPGLWSVITQNDGKISPSFIATSSAYAYNWFGPHSFSATTTMATSTQASSTITNLNVKNLAITGTLATSFGQPVFYGATSTSKTVANTSSETTYGLGGLGTISAGSFSTNDVLKARLYISALAGAAGSSQLTFNVKLGATVVCTLTSNGDITGTTAFGFVDFSMNATSTGAESCRSNMMLPQQTPTINFNQTFAAVDLTQSQLITFTVQWNSASVSNTVTIAGAEVMKL